MWNQSARILIDENLIFYRYINNLIGSSMGTLCNLYRTKYLNQKLKMMLVNSVIFSKIDYCNSILTNIKKKDPVRLQKLINQAMRYVHKVKKYDHISFFSKCLPILKILTKLNYDLPRSIKQHEIMIELRKPNYSYFSYRPWIAKFQQTSQWIKSREEVQLI